MNERFTRFLKEIGKEGNGAEMNRAYLGKLSTHPDLMPGNVLDVLHELAEVATMAIVTNGFDKVQSRRVKESGIADFMEEVFVSERADSEKPNRKILTLPSKRSGWRTANTFWWWATASPATFRAASMRAWTPAG